MTRHGDSGLVPTHGEKRHMISRRIFARNLLQVKSFTRLFTEGPLRVSQRGEALLNNAQLNKGVAFTREERKELDLDGRLPYAVATLDVQCERAYQQYQSRDAPIHKNTFLQSLKAQNWTLYYGLISRHLKEMIPIIYTPTEAEAISSYSHLFRRSEGLYLSYPDMEDMEKNYLAAIESKEIDLIICTDGGQILGIGDQGVGGIGISTAKAALYTLVLGCRGPTDAHNDIYYPSLIGGIDPSRILPVTLDVGTNNKDLLDDPLYIGWSHERLQGDQYDAFVDKFVNIVKKHNRHSLLHFEDFGNENAQRLLDIYQPKLSLFNDDIQGTGAVTLAAVLAAIGVTKSKLSEQRIICFGAGSAGLGICNQIRDAMMQLESLDRKSANSCFYLIDRHGLLTDHLQQEKKVNKGAEEYVRQDWNGPTGLLDVVKTIKPTILMGVSTQGGAFTEEVIRAMKDSCDRPIIFPLSNPTRLTEVTPQNCLGWTGAALMATGSPFSSVKVNDRSIDIAECNNALIYPGLGFGTIISRSRVLSPGMILAGAQRLANLSAAPENPHAALLPDVEDSPSVNMEIAISVAEKAFDEGVATVPWKKEEVRERAMTARWHPVGMLKSNFLMHPWIVEQ
ncbi:hypothetical protein Clacol_005978 [Clathrus columnatus]|uniref:Malic enzyme n=1 Tax=Clathrus columnatus TaxID=1419009 RepID=A0AAV5AIG7_9AGAM|nr:hypothetical protein Clacol_005978 [Clathrus columnatus]